MALTAWIMPEVAVVGAVFNLQRVDLQTGALDGRVFGLTAGQPLWTLKATIRDGDQLVGQCRSGRNHSVGSAGRSAAEPS